MYEVANYVVTPVTMTMYCMICKVLDSLTISFPKPSRHKIFYNTKDHLEPTNPHKIRRNTMSSI